MIHIINKDRLSEAEKKACTTLKQATSANGGWNSVKNGLPDQNGAYFVCNNELKIYGIIYFFVEEADRWRLNGGYEITHWMNLPELPDS